jgi:hypothetical protein
MTAQVLGNHELENPGVSEAGALGITGGLPTAVNGHESVATIMLEDLFDGDASRPIHPWLGRPIEPRDLAAIKVRLGR